MTEATNCAVLTATDVYNKRLERIQRVSAVIISMGLVQFIIQTFQILSYRLSMSTPNFFIFPVPPFGQGYILSILSICTGLYGIKITRNPTRFRSIIYLMLNGFISFIGLLIFITNIFIFDF